MRNPDLAVGSKEGSVANNRLLNALSARDYETLTAHVREVALQRGDVLHRPGDLIEHVYFLHSGMVSLLAVLEGGAAVETVSIGSDGAVGTIEGFGALTAFTHALVQVPGTAGRISGAVFRRLVAESADLADALNHYHMAVMAHVQQTSACNTLHDLTQRLARILLLTHDRCNDGFMLTQEALAQMLGVRRPSVSVAARSLRDLVAIDYRRGVIKVLDRALLEQSACECYRTISRAIDTGFKGAERPTRK